MEKAFCDTLERKVLGRQRHVSWSLKGKGGGGRGTCRGLS
jgi:hypothetical protein